MSILEKLRDKVGHDVTCPGLWVLVATDGQNDMPVLDHAVIPLITPGQRAKVSEAWISNEDRGEVTTKHTNQSEAWISNEDRGEVTTKHTNHTKEKAGT